MLRYIFAFCAAASLCILAPQEADAAPSLDWDGKAELMGGYLGLSPDALPSGLQGDKVARNIGQGVKGGLYLGVGIPLSIVGGIFTGLAIHSFVSADAALALGGDDAEAAAFVSRIVGLICLSIGFGLLSPGISLIIKGAKALSKISDASRVGPDPRMARAEKNRARWGMRFAVASAPMRR